MPGLQNEDSANFIPPALVSGAKLHGILLPLATPFKDSGEVDHLALRNNIAAWSTRKVKGYVLLGSTGERVHLDESESLQVVATARAAVPRGDEGLAFIVGAGQQSTLGTINEIKAMADAGADAVLVITPNFYRSAITQEALISHYTKLADASPVPVILYSMPVLTGIKIEPETIARLSEHQNIIGVKDSSNDVQGLKRTVDLVHERKSSASQGKRRDDFVVLTGNGTVLNDALLAGADGGILAVGGVAPELCIEIFEAFKAGASERAAALQERLTPLAQAVTTRYGIGGLKAALDMMGLVGGAVREPLRSPSEDARQEIGSCLKEAQAALAQPAAV